MRQRRWFAPVVAAVVAAGALGGEAYARDYGWVTRVLDARSPLANQSLRANDGDLALDGAGLPVMAFRYGDSAGVRVIRHDGVGFRWDLVPGTAGADQHEMRLDSTGGLLLAWHDAATQETRLTRGTFDPPTATWAWTTEVVAQDTGRAVGLALGATGNLGVAYASNAQGGLVLAQHNGGAWTHGLVAATGTLMDASVVFDAQNRPHVAYADDVTNEVRYAAWSGGSWGNQKVSDASEFTYANLVLDGNDVPFVAYRHRTSRVQAHVSQLAGGVWETTVIQTASGAPAHDWDPMLHVDGAGNVHAAGRLSGRSVPLSTYAGGVWTHDAIPTPQVGPRGHGLTTTGDGRRMMGSGGDEGFAYGLHYQSHRAGFLFSGAELFRVDDEHFGVTQTDLFGGFGVTLGPGDVPWKARSGVVSEFDVFYPEHLGQNDSVGVTQAYVAGSLTGPELTGLKYNAETGKLYAGGRRGMAIYAVDPVGLTAGAFTAEGMIDPWDLEFGPDGQLYVADALGDRVARFDTATGDLIGTFTSGFDLEDPFGLLFLPGGELLVSDRGSKSIVVFDATGAFERVLATFAAEPHDMLLQPNGELLVALGMATLGRVDMSDGTLIETVLLGAEGGTAYHGGFLAALPEPGTGLLVGLGAVGLVWRRGRRQS